MQDKQTAILIFANSSQEELKHKNVIHGERLFDCFTSQTLKEVHKTGLPYVLYSEKEQYGTNFGERFSNAIEDLFSKGYEKVITIGNDSPHLKASHLIEAHNTLTKNDIVVGPSMDGGLYLLGLHKKDFDKNSFLKLPWQTSQLLKKLKAHVVQSGLDILTLQRLRDVDGLQDLKWFFNQKRLVFRAFKRILLAIFIFSTKKYYFPLNTTSLYTVRIPLNKGSPAFPIT